MEQITVSFESRLDRARNARRLKIKAPDEITDVASYGPQLPRVLSFCLPSPNERGSERQILCHRRLTIPRPEAAGTKDFRTDPVGTRRRLAGLHPGLLAPVRAPLMTRRQCLRR